MKEAFFQRSTEFDNRFTPTGHCRGPWNENHCHAGPPTGLLARALEQAIPKQRLTRLTVELTRPIPFEGFDVSVTILRQGRTVSTAEAYIHALNGKPVLSARGLFMAQAKTPLTFPESVRKTSPVYDYGSPEDATAGPFTIGKTLHELPSFKGDGVQTRYPAGQIAAAGSTVAWLKTVPLLSTETPSAFQRICPLADCGNAFGRLAEPTEIGFMNTDLTILLHRDPVGEWMGTDSECFWETDGIGMSDSRLFDAHGVVGRAMQTLLLR